MKFLICFDLEGLLSPQDNAYGLMKLIPDGDKLFEVISRYKKGQAGLPAAAALSRRYHEFYG